MPNNALIREVKVAGNTAYQITEAGLKMIGDCAKLGMSHEAIADILEVGQQWLSKQIATNEAVGVHFRFNTANGERELRAAMHDVAVAGDVQMLKFLGERRLSMRERVDHKHDHVVQVIGTLPKSVLTSTEWRDQFAPKDIIDADYVQLPAPENNDGSESDRAGTVHAETAGAARDLGAGERRDEGGSGGSDASN